MTRYTRCGEKIWARIFSDKPVTVRPIETRMGSGKGSPEYWVYVVKPDRILYETVEYLKLYQDSFFNNCVQNAYTNSICYFRIRM